MRRLSLLLILGLIILTLVGCGEAETQMNGSKITIDNEVVLKSENLHNSEKQPPEKSVLVKKQEELTKNIYQTEVTEAKTTLHEIHMYFENGFIYESENWIKKLSDPESPGWIFWEKTGIIEIPGYTEKVDNQKSGDTYIQWLDNVKQVFSDPNLIDDITTVQKLIKYAVDNHDIKGLWYAHQVLHDLDYWALNYPIHYPIGKPAPPDWKGIDTYFGVTKTLEGSHSLNTEELLNE